VLNDWAWRYQDLGGTVVKKIVSLVFPPIHLADANRIGRTDKSGNMALRMTFPARLALHASSEVQSDQVDCITNGLNVS
jgi:hypothetical protein